MRNLQAHVSEPWHTALLGKGWMDMKFDFDTYIIVNYPPLGIYVLWIIEKNVIQYLQYSKELKQIYWCRKFNLTGDDERGAYQITNTCMQSC